VIDVSSKPRLDRFTAAPVIGVSPRLLGDRQWRDRNKVPHYRIGGRVFYDIASLLTWLERRRVHGSAE
jgi:hypothetical protein